MMGLFGKGKSKEALLEEESKPCTHPVSHQVPLYEDDYDRHKVTGVKCSQCGAVLAPEAVA